MDKLDGATIFWLITLGLVAGGGLKLFLGENRGISILSNLIGGVLGCLIVGITSIKLNVPGSLLLALMGTMAILFLANVFFMEDDSSSHEADEQLV